MGAWILPFHEKRQITEDEQNRAQYYFYVVKGRPEFNLAENAEKRSEEESPEDCNNPHPPLFGKEKTKDNKGNTSKHNQQTQIVDSHPCAQTQCIRLVMRSPKWVIGSAGKRVRNHIIGVEGSSNAVCKSFRHSKSRKKE